MIKKERMQKRRRKRWGERGREAGRRRGRQTMKRKTPSEKQATNKKKSDMMKEKNTARHWRVILLISK